MPSDPQCKPDVPQDVADAKPLTSKELQQLSAQALGIVDAQPDTQRKLNMYIQLADTYASVHRLAEARDNYHKAMSLSRVIDGVWSEKLRGLAYRWYECALAVMVAQARVEGRRMTPPGRIPAERFDVGVVEEVMAGLERVRRGR